tara:strand:- start:7556 stop:8569 length:1014 start_codon:yes stop_codon:yes gene_type:complete
MANPYTSVSISGYNATPPSDDGTVADSNKVNWSKHKDKLADPIKTLAESMDTNTLAAFVKRFGNAVTAFAADHTLVAGNEGAVLSFTGTRTLTLLPAATATGGFIFAVYRAGAGDITIDGDGAETIDGAATLVLTEQNTAAILVSDGSNWITISKPPTVVPASDTWTRVSTVAITTALTELATGVMASGYDYRIRAENFCPTDDGEVLWAKISDDSAANWEGDAGDYQWGMTDLGNGTTNESDTEIQISGTGTLGFDANNTNWIELTITNPGDTTIFKTLKWNGFYMNGAATPVLQPIIGGATSRATAAVTNMRLEMSSGSTFKNQGTFIVERRLRG